jgi:hypothetical protein
MTAEEIKKDIRAAIKQFGEYQFFDKGLYETMDVDKYKKMFVGMSAKEAADLMIAVIKADKKYGEHFVMGVLINMDDQPDAYWDKLMERPELEKLY